MSQTLQQQVEVYCCFFFYVLLRSAMTPSLPVQVHSSTTSTTTNEKDWSEK